MEKGSKNHKETLYSSKGKIVYVVGKPCIIYRLQGKTYDKYRISLQSVDNFNKRSVCEWMKTYLAFQIQFSDNFSKVFATYSVSFLSSFISVYFSWRNLLVFIHRKTYLIPKESENWDSRMKLLFFTAQFPEGYFLPLCCHKTKGQILFSCC